MTYVYQIIKQEQFQFQLHTVHDKMDKANLMGIW